MTWGKKTNKRLLAVTVSIALHALLLVGLIPSSGSTLANVSTTGEGESEAEGIRLDLVGIEDDGAAPARAFQAPAAQSSPMDTFMQMTDTTAPSSETPSNISNPAKSISEALGENPFEAQPGAAARTAAENHVNANNTSVKTPNDLWKAIAPCWNRIADKNTLPVVLEVSFSPMGNLAKPPTIRRNTSMPITDQMLRSESQAISALSQCGPYLMVFGQENVSVGFPKKS
ncbi:hypothetical protein MMA231_04033 (plasmid) [Asticcacaulis sp. MM231]|uniref:hypothetical protein n=1 Tax=Asticcacaulis sp. MM231 TaxID=3157666 RepID=UPI0032D56A3A